MGIKSGDTVAHTVEYADIIEDDEFLTGSQRWLARSSAVADSCGDVVFTAVRMVGILGNTSTGDVETFTRNPVDAVKLTYSSRYDQYL